MWEARFLFWEFLISFQSVVDLATTRLWGYHGLSFWGVHYIVFHAPKALSIVHQKSSKYKGSCLNLSACLAFRKDKLGEKSRGNVCGLRPMYIQACYFSCTTPGFVLLNSSALQENDFQSSRIRLSALTDSSTCNPVARKVLPGTSQQRSTGG